MAWELVGACTGSITPTISPAQYGCTCKYRKCVAAETAATNCTSGSSGCSCTCGQAVGTRCTEAVKEESCTNVDVKPWAKEGQ